MPQARRALTGADPDTGIEWSRLRDEGMRSMLCRMVELAAALGADAARPLTQPCGPLPDQRQKSVFRAWLVAFTGCWV